MRRTLIVCFMQFWPAASAGIPEAHTEVENTKKSTPLSNNYDIVCAHIQPQKRTHTQTAGTIPKNWPTMLIDEPDTKLLNMKTLRKTGGPKEAVAMLKKLPIRVRYAHIHHNNNA